MEFTSGRPPDTRYDAFVAAAEHAVVGLDMDGTLSPIVEDPELAHIHPEAPEGWSTLAPVVRALAIITGRPARQALALGGLDEVGDAIGDLGRELYVLGQYGNERWSSSRAGVILAASTPRARLVPAPSCRVAAAAGRRAATRTSRRRGLAVAVHTRRLPDPEAAFGRIEPPLTELAKRHGLVIEPGRNVFEVRAPGVDKGAAIRRLTEELGAGAVCFAGDDLGDLEAFAAVEELRATGCRPCWSAPPPRTERAPRPRRPRRLRPRWRRRPLTPARRRHQDPSTTPS